MVEVEKVDQGKYIVSCKGKKVGEIGKEKCKEGQRRIKIALVHVGEEKETGKTG